VPTDTEKKRALFLEVRDRICRFDAWLAVGIDLRAEPDQAYVVVGFEDEEHLGKALVAVIWQWARLRGMSGVETLKWMGESLIGTAEDIEQDERLDPTRAIAEEIDGGEEPPCRA